jgi:hypothetical protein
MKPVSALTTAARAGPSDEAFERMLRMLRKEQQLFLTFPEHPEHPVSHLVIGAGPRGTSMVERVHRGRNGSRETGALHLTS